MCGVSNKGFDRKWMVTWSGNQKLCCSWGHPHCCTDSGFYLKVLILQRGRSGWRKPACQMSGNQHPTGTRFPCVTNALFCTDVFPQNFFAKCSYCIVWWILHVLFLDFLTLSLIWYSTIFIIINYYSQEKWLHRKGCLPNINTSFPVWDSSG